MAKSDHRAEVFEEVGRALTDWSRVEDSVCDLFHRVTLGRAYAISATVFYSLIANSTRFTVMIESGRWYFKFSGFEAEYARMMKHLDRLAKRRNIVAHAMCWNDFQEDPFEWYGYLGRHPGDFKTVWRELAGDGERTEMRVDDIKCFRADCKMMWRWIGEFRVRTEPWHSLLEKSPRQHLDRVRGYKAHPKTPSPSPRIAGLLPPPRPSQA